MTDDERIARRLEREAIRRDRERSKSVKPDPLEDEETVEARSIAYGVGFFKVRPPSHYQTAADHVQ